MKFSDVILLTSGWYSFDKWYRYVLPSPRGTPPNIGTNLRGVPREAPQIIKIVIYEIC